jgi:transcriptional repressor NrdR
MRCIQCGSLKDKVLDSRASKDGTTIRRRRECLNCSYRYTTYEQIEHDPLMVVKRDGRREVFSKEKLTSSLQRACQKRSVSEDDIASAVERIQDGLVEGFDRETTSRTIGERVMRELRNLDPVAYVRFASIYRNFEEATDFVSEVERLGSLPIADKRQLELIAEAEAAA